jgi:hypothetical protein
MSDHNHVRWHAGQGRGQVESIIVKANSPDGLRAVTLRMGLLAPSGQPDAAVGECWALSFDRVARSHRAARGSQPIAQCLLARDRFEIRVCENRLWADGSVGELSGPAGRLGWELEFDPGPLPDRPPFEEWARTPVPGHKLLSSHPDLRVRGRFRVDGEVWALEDWPGMLAHSWGPRHPPGGAWGHCNTFEGEVGTWFLGQTVQGHAGPLRGPMRALLHLHRGGEDLRFQRLRSFLRGHSSTGRTWWRFEAENRGWVLRGVIQSEAEGMVGLYVRNPDAEITHLLTSMVAHADLFLLRRTGWREDPVTQLSSHGSAGLSLVVPDPDHGVTMVL